MNGLTKFAAVLLMPMVTACVTTTSTATERAICDVWRDSLVKISHADTEKTQEDVKTEYARQRAVCR